MKQLYILFTLAFCLAIQSCKKEEDPVKEAPILINTIPEFYLEAEEARYGIIPPEYKELATGIGTVVGPIDLDFNKAEGRTNELWVLNHGTENTGSSTGIIFNPGEETQSHELRQDGNAWHFMALATALDFSEDGNWGTSQGILDANRRGSNYTGPSLWPSDLDIYAKVGNPVTPSVNGSHLDMIHQSPYGMGICNLGGSEYFVFDGFHGNLTYYNFGVGHYPGGSDHGDGKVIHFGEVKLSRDPSGTLPGHMEIDADKKWLYVVDTDKKRILKVDVTSGSLKNSPSIPLMNGEPLSLYGEMENVDWAVFAEGNMSKPCGLAIKENRVFVSDNQTGEIICFDTESGDELGRIATGAESIMGIAIGPNGRLWYVDKNANKVFQVIGK